MKTYGFGEKYALNSLLTVETFQPIFDIFDLNFP